METLLLIHVFISLLILPLEYIWWRRQVYDVSCILYILSRIVLNI